MHAAVSFGCQALHGLLVGRDWFGILKRACATLLCRVATAKDVLHERADVVGLVGQRHRDAVALLDLPFLLDAVVDQGHQTSGDDNAVQADMCQYMIYFEATIVTFFFGHGWVDG